MWGRIAVRMSSHNRVGNEGLGVPFKLVVDGTAFQKRSAGRAKVLLECDRRSEKIEIGNAQKEGGSTLTLVFFGPLSSTRMAVVDQTSPEHAYTYVQSE